MIHSWEVMQMGRRHSQHVTTGNDREYGKEVLPRILKDTKPIAGWMILSCLICVTSIILGILAPKTLGNITDVLYEYWTAKTANPMEQVAHKCIILAALYLGSSLCNLVDMVLMNNVVSRLFTCTLRIRISDKIQRLPIKYVDSTPNGEIISRMTDDVSVMGNTIHSFLNTLINGGLKLIFISVVLIRMNWLMAICIIVFVPFSLFLSSKISTASRKYHRASREKNGKAYALMEESFTGFDTVKAFSLEKLRVKEQGELIEAKVQTKRKGDLLSGIVSPIIALTNNIAYIIICLLGGYLALKGILSVGSIVAFILYAKLYAGPLEAIANGLSSIQRTLAAASRVYSLLDEPEMEETTDTSGMKDGAIEFSHVDFSYSEEHPLIEDMNVSVKPGQKIAIVGPTGGGKTTIVNLLMRFYDITGGKILLDGYDIGKMDRSHLRSYFGMVLQDTWLFSGTIYDNIAYGKADATKEEVYEAAKRAHIDHFIRSLPEGYDTVINEESTNISGGQKQLLTIARAYLSNRPMLILDEATSNVDTRTEILIQKTMDELMKGRTSFVIAHRLSTIVDADLILVVRNGHIVEQGSHKELMEKNGFYTEIYNSQYALLTS